MPVLRTFIVEDSPVILDNLSAALEEMAPVAVVGHAADEKGAVEALRALDGAVDLVIIDVFLRGGSGWGVLRQMSRFGMDANRIVLSNYATPDMSERCLALGANRVFDKSSDFDALIDYCTELARSIH